MSLDENYISGSQILGQKRKATQSVIGPEPPPPKRIRTARIPPTPKISLEELEPVCRLEIEPIMLKSPVNDNDHVIHSGILTPCLSGVHEDDSDEMDRVTLPGGAVIQTGDRVRMSNGHIRDGKVWLVERINSQQSPPTVDIKRGVIARNILPEHLEIINGGSEDSKKEVDSWESIPNGTKTRSTAAGDYLKVAFACDQGVRPTMEDRHFVLHSLPSVTPPVKGLKGEMELLVGVLDGHGGIKAAEFAANKFPHYLAKQVRSQDSMEEALIKAVELTDTDFCNMSDASGSCCCLALIEGKHEDTPRRVYCANTGDSRCVVSSKGSAIPLSRDHKPSDPDEKKRISDNQGFIFHNRVMGVLAVSRTLGDGAMKKAGKFLIATPEVQIRDLIPDDEFIIVACDGLWDVMSNEEVVDFIRSRLLSRPSKSLDEISSALVTHAVGEKGSLDNVSLVISLCKDPSTYEQI